MTTTPEALPANLRGAGNARQGPSISPSCGAGTGTASGTGPWALEPAGDLERRNSLSRNSSKGSISLSGRERNSAPVVWIADLGKDPAVCDEVLRAILSDWKGAGQAGKADGAGAKAPRHTPTQCDKVVVLSVLDTVTHMMGPELRISSQMLSEKARQEAEGNLKKDVLVPFQRRLQSKKVPVEVVVVRNDSREEGLLETMSRFRATRAYVGLRWKLKLVSSIDRGVEQCAKRLPSWCTLVAVGGRNAPRRFRGALDSWETVCSGRAGEAAPHPRLSAASGAGRASTDTAPHTSLLSSQGQGGFEAAAGAGTAGAAAAALLAAPTPPRLIFPPSISNGANSGAADGFPSAPAVSGWLSSAAGGSSPSWHSCAGSEGRTSTDYLPWDAETAPSSWVQPPVWPGPLHSHEQKDEQQQDLQFLQWQLMARGAQPSGGALGLRAESRNDSDSSRSSLSSQSGVSQASGAFPSAALPGGSRQGPGASPCAAASSVAKESSMERRRMQPPVRVPGPRGPGDPLEVRMEMGPMLQEIARLQDAFSTTAEWAAQGASGGIEIESAREFMAAPDVADGGASARDTTEGTSADVFPLCDRSHVREYSRAQLVSACNGFSPENLIRGGEDPLRLGLAEYRGILDSSAVSVKTFEAAMKLSNGREEAEQMFQEQISVQLSLRHPGFVLLIGACYSPPCLVYEAMPQGSLYDRLVCQGGSAPLHWKVRLDILEDVAKALLFCHRREPQPMVLLNLNPKNVLLTRSLTAKLADAGSAHFLLSRLGKPVSAFLEHSKAVGAGGGYVDPAFANAGAAPTPASDVFSFGMLVLDVLLGIAAPQGRRSASGEAARANAEMARKDRRSREERMEEYVDSHDEAGVVSVLDGSAGAWPQEVGLALASLAVRCRATWPRNRPGLAKDVLPHLQQLQELAGLLYEQQKDEERKQRATLATKAPDYFVCPITLEVMEDPVTLSDGQTYEKEAIEDWLTRSSTSPSTGLPLQHLQLMENITLRTMIQNWKQSKDKEKERSKKQQQQQQKQQQNLQ